MKVGDLVIMPGQTIGKGEKPDVGIVIDDVPQYRTKSRNGKGRVGIMWADSGFCVDYEPKAWLEVINESR